VTIAEPSGVGFTNQDLKPMQKRTGVGRGQYLTREGGIKKEGGQRQGGIGGREVLSHRGSYERIRK